MKTIPPLGHKITVYSMVTYIDSDGLVLSHPFWVFDEALEEQRQNEYTEGLVSWVETRWVASFPKE
jgi:hypothetical protein